MFLQWPLRDIVRCCSREANDLGQIIFALFVAVSVTAATRAGTHLAADTLAQRYSRAHAPPPAASSCAAIGLLPWAVFVVRSPARASCVASVLELEAFPDTNNPGYYVIKLALWIMALLMIAQALRRYFPPAAAG